MKSKQIQPVVLEDDSIRILDQTQLPGRVHYIVCRGLEDVADAIQKLSIRGAPAIGVAASMALALEMDKQSPAVASRRIEVFESLYDRLVATRPTAVNLKWALDRMAETARKHASESREEFSRALRNEAAAICREEVQRNEAIGMYGRDLVPNPATVVTICNTGSLAAPGIGTALGVIRMASSQGKEIHVVVCETRPLLQGARLTTWELSQDGIPHTLITDGMAAYYLRVKGADLIIAGADRIAANGDTANKIGTYALAVLAGAHGVPFYIAAPVSTIDTAAVDGSSIPIEERSPEEVVCIQDRPIAPDGVSVWNPAFDVVPNEYISGIITDKGIAVPPFTESIAAL